MSEDDAQQHQPARPTVRAELGEAVGGIAWTLGYDTIYAHQDKEDDVLIGVKSSALALGSRTRPWLFVFYVAAVALWAASGRTAGLGWPFWLGLALVLVQLLWQAARVDIDDA
ncbi:MAG TPA: UbiA family prenyltransferase, partial [Stellaceae bacterium]